uniref:PLD phosphodiesterase domain-containing protein n=1 Tax=Percolomonas cosmopolitus TaxID=63605 RepID=A0A7S1KUC7_9EUKA|mmetsp:Transcript_8864/g.32720  ORF Transcript_8864/g.32720 Transcript_8864/m.32720 type:complete len:512 (+) Transcript_8864:141-1676(+)|eukprot:CAMPEP_0117452054 /NCGR_PEP_ID=MMETSP0759-20121206/9374_1 /TAXON_ID=63605 /ORGANISM="Percolomonas cosmopolitus, Strain WS" /LENGTH=511 /DNA_ID=CAMNT_0005244771 /DNA_START=125 /DNA_END=1660 /DNA_ORIENTATION=+
MPASALDASSRPSEPHLSNSTSPDLAATDALDGPNSDSPNFILQPHHNSKSSIFTPLNFIHTITVILIFIVSFIIFVTFLSVALPFSASFRKTALSVSAPNEQLFVCDKCEYKLVETIPDQLIVPKAFSDTTETWLEIINGAKNSLKMLVFYWDMTNDVHPHGDNGRRIMEALEKRAKEISIQIVQYRHTSSFPDEPDLGKLREWGIDVVEIDWEQAFGGVLHTKLIMADEESFYIGSANMDWKSLNQVKELGIKVDCACLGADVDRLFKKYYYLGTQLNSSFSGFTGWPQESFTALTAQRPMQVPFNGQGGEAYLTAAPKLLAAPGRTYDLDALVGTIENADEFVYISVMDYLPFAYYGSPHGWWGEIDNAVRDAFARGANVKMLISKWDHSPEIQVNALRSLVSFGQEFCNRTEYHGYKWCESTLEVREYVVPDPHGYEKYPFTRVNHAKYMVTDKDAFLTTSNWSKDYYYKTAGSTLVMTHKNVRADLVEVFMRDWNSQYAYDLPVNQ